MTKRSFVQEHCFPALLAEKLGQELGVPRGSLWYPGCTKSIERCMAASPDASREQVELTYRLRLGLEEVGL
jgi:hypothetical protein